MLRSRAQLSDMEYEKASYIYGAYLHVRKSCSDTSEIFDSSAYRFFTLEQLCK